MKIKLLILFVGLVSVQCQVESDVAPTSPYEKSLFVNEYDYDAVFSVINHNKDEYKMDAKMTPDTLKGTTTVVPYAQKWTDARPITFDYDSRFDYFDFDLPRSLVFEINGLKSWIIYENIKPAKTYFYPTPEEKNKAYAQFDKEVKEGTKWKVYFADENSAYKKNNKTDFSISQTLQLKGFPDYPTLQKLYTFDKETDWVINFPAIKNADVIYFEFRCGPVCLKKEERKYQTLGWIKAVPGNATSVTLKKAEMQIMGTYGFRVYVSAVRSEVFKVNNKSYLIQNISRTQTEVEPK